MDVMMKKAEFEKNSEDETKNFEDETSKLTEGGTDIEKLAFGNKLCSAATPFVCILSETQMEMFDDEEYISHTKTLQILLDDYWKASYQIRKRSRNCREQLRPTNSRRGKSVDECFLTYDGKLDSLEKIFLPNQVNLLGCQKDMEHMQKDTGEKHRFRHKIVIRIAPFVRSSEKRHIYNIHVKSSNKLFNGLDSLEKLCHPNEVKPLGSQKDMGLMQMDNREKKRFRLSAIERRSWSKRFDTIREAISPIFFIHSSEKRDIYRDLKPSYKQFDGVSAVDATDFTALDISSLFLQSENKDKEMKMTEQEVGAWGAKDEADLMALQWWHKPSHLKNTWPISHVLQLLLLLTLLSIITFLTALKIMGCKSEGFKNNSSINPICQMVNEYPDFVRLIIAFNTLAFFLSVAMMLIIFNKLPLRQLLLVSAFSMLGAYMCIISGPSKPTLSSFYSTFDDSWMVK